MQLKTKAAVITTAPEVDVLRITISREGAMLTFCLTAKECKKLARALRRFAKNMAV